MAVLESIEKLPVYLYDAAGGSINGLQTLTRRLRFRFERAPGETGLTDRIGRCDTNAVLKLYTILNIYIFLKQALNNGTTDERLS